MFIAVALCLGLLHMQAAETLCAKVQLQINQQVTFERQGFIASLTIANSTALSKLEDVQISLYFTDVEGDLVSASTNPDATGVKFFYRVADNSSVPQQVEIAQTVTAQWLIIPSAGAGVDPQGTPYYVGATLSYKINGEVQNVEIIPAYIYVQPQPLLKLDYFLPLQVYGDNPTTSEKELPVEFYLGLRVLNTGVGVANAIKIESGQPRITNNPQGLDVRFVLLRTSVNDQPAVNSLLANVGNLAGGQGGVARWTMTSSLSGQFAFTASFTHADSLGGAATSLIAATNSHGLIRDVLVDIPGRDGVRDFLAMDGVYYSVYESQGIDTTVQDVSTNSSLGVTGMDGVWQTGTVPGFLYSRQPDPFSGAKIMTSVKRSDGKDLNPHNFWSSRKFNVEANQWEHYLNIFDSGNTTGASYQIKFGNEILGPVLYPISDQLAQVGRPLTFKISAYDPSGAIPRLGSSSLPVGSTLVDNNDGTATFTWTPGNGQAGSFPITFQALSNNILISKTALISVSLDSLLQSWKNRYWPNTTSTDIVGDTANPSGDGIPNLLKYALGLDPTKPAANSGVLIGVIVVDGKRYLTLTYVARSNDSNLTYSVLGSGSPSAPDSQWTTQTESMQADQAGVPEGMTRYVVRDSVAFEDGAPRRFLKLQVKTGGSQP